MTSRYRKLMSEAMAEVELNEVGYLQSKLNDKQIQNIKKIWQFKTKNDVTPAVIKMIKNMDTITQGAIKDAGIKYLSDIAENSIVEGRMSEIDAMRKAGASAAKIAKELGIAVKTVKAILGEQEVDSAQDMQDIKPAKEKIKEDEDKDLEEFIDDVKNNTPNSEQFDEEKKKKKDDVAPDNDVPIEVKEQEDQSSEIDKLKKELEKSREQTVAVKQKAQTDAQKQAQRARTAQDKMVNPETGEPLLQVGIAYKHLKQKMEKEAEAQKKKEESGKIKDLASDKKDLEESAASDKAKAMGLNYMKFGRYGKDGKVTHKTSGDNLVKVGKNDEPTDDKPAKKPDEPKKDTGGDKESDTKIKSRNFLKDLEDGKLETKDGDTIELDFDDEFSFQAAMDKANEMGLSDLADDIESVGSYVAEMEPEKAQADYQDMIAKYSGKKVKALEFAKKADEAIDMFSDSASADDNWGVSPGNESLHSENLKTFRQDLANTMKIVQKMVDSDKTEGNPGSGMSNPSKGFRPEVIETIQSLEKVSSQLDEIRDNLDDNLSGTNVEEVKDIISEIQGEIEFCTDENADHDGYTKSYKVNSSIESIQSLVKKLNLKKVKPPKTTKLPSGETIQKNLADKITGNGYVDVDFDGEELKMSKEYDSSQEKQAEQDMKTISDYLTKKGVKLNKDDMEIEKTDDYIKITVNKNVQKMDESRLDYVGRLIMEKKYKNFKEDLNEAKYTINYEVDSDSGADNRYVGNSEMDVNASSPKDAVKKFGNELNKTVKQAQARGSKSILSVYMNYIEKDGSMISDREVDKLNDYASDLIYKGVYDSYMKDDLDKKDEPKVKDVIKGLKKASDLHKQQHQKLTKALKTEMKKDDAYAIGMAQAKKVMNDEPPLQKKTIKKGHEIADKILKKEDVDLQEAGISPQMIATLKKEYEPFRGKKISAARARQLMNILNKFKDSDLQKLGKENIPFISSGSRSKLAVRNMKFTVKNIQFGEELDEEMFEACWTGYKRVGMKKKNGKMVPNCVPEAIDPFMISYSRYGKHAGFEGGKTLQDIQKKAQELRKKGFTIDKMGRNNPPVKKENAPSEADIERLKKQGMKPRKEQKDHPAAAVYESISAVKKKAEKSGMPYGVLKKVYDRGMAAWRGGHRPGATQVQWALARVNSFVTKSSGTWGGADKDLAKQVKGK
tara:strand:+ start:9719 stop:13258 length:3540 start_codon:yes stop_codon:yes gene_type:complete